LRRSSVVLLRFCSSFTYLLAVQEAEDLLTQQLAIIKPKAEKLSLTTTTGTGDKVKNFLNRCVCQ